MESKYKTKALQICKQGREGYDTLYDILIENGIEDITIDKMCQLAEEVENNCKTNIQLKITKFANLDSKNEDFEEKIDAFNESNFYENDGSFSIVRGFLNI